MFTQKLNRSTPILLFSCLWIVFACKGPQDDVHPPKKGVTIVQKPIVEPPVFNEDSALYFTQKQVDFGFRIPNTPEHDACGVWLKQKLASYGFEVMVQEGKAKAWTNEILNIHNIIGQWKPEKKQRILLAAHWDTRPFADNDSILPNKPILGANDGASGVAVLLEVARNIQLQSPEIGVDIILFDTEDYGALSNDGSFMDVKSQNDTWCLGSQYWANHPPIADYRPLYGILLDMVGAADAQFYKEGYSREYLSSTLNKIWKDAQDLGYGNYFVNKMAPPIIDDHKYVNEIARIPMLDIVDYKPKGNTGYYGFGAFHHTHADNMAIIDKKTLKAVGHTVLYTIYNH